MSITKSAAAMLFALALLINVQPAQAGTTILEGSDAIAFHCESVGEAGACTYEAQVWKALDGATGKPIAVIYNPSNFDIPLHSQGSGITIDSFTSVAAAGTLGNYAAVYFEAAFTCCSEDDSLITAAGAASDVSSYLAGGGTVMIENYDGGSAWDFAVGAGGNGSANTAGVGGALFGPGCTDGETVTATGLTNGFTQPPPIGCWTHQAYNESFFGPLGFTLSFFNADPAFAADNPGFGPFSSLLSNGQTQTGGGGGQVPEPASLALLGGSLVGMGGLIRRKLRR